MVQSIDERFEQVFGELKKIHRQIFWLNFFTGLKFLLVVIPLILAFIYLPPVIAPYINNLEKVLLLLAGIRQ